MAEGLTSLDPSPISSPSLTPVPSNQPSKPRPSYNATSASTTTLGLTTSNLRALQKYSSYAFLAFTTAHITNTAVLPLALRSATDANRYILLTRPYYQSFPLEHAIIIAPALTHVISGLLLRIHRRRVTVKRLGAETPAEKRSIPWPQVTSISALGFGTAWLVGAHSALNRWLPLHVEGGSSDIGLDFVGHGVAIAPLAGFLFYTALVTVAGSHAVLGLGRWMGWLPSGAGWGGRTLEESRGGAPPANQEAAAKRRTKWWAMVAVEVGVVGLWLAGGVGVVCRNGKVGGWVGKVYDGLYKRVPILGWYV